MSETPLEQLTQTFVHSDLAAACAAPFSDQSGDLRNCRCPGPDNEPCNRCQWLPTTTYNEAIAAGKSDAAAWDEAYAAIAP